MAESDEPTVPIYCPECDTESRIPLSELADGLERHNETHHEGEDVAAVDPALVDHLANLVVEDMGLLDEE